MLQSLASAMACKTTHVATAKSEDVKSSEDVKMAGKWFLARDAKSA